MPIIKVIRNGQITLPKEFREALNIDKGQVLEAELKESRIILKPLAFVENGHALSLKGKKQVKKALEAYKKGKTKAFDNVDDLIKDLNS